MPNLLDRILRRKQPEVPTELYRPPEQGEEVTEFGIGDVLEAAGENQSGAPAVADGVRNTLPGPFIVPDRTIGTVKGVDRDLIFVAFPIEVPAAPWKKVRGDTEWATGDRLKATENIPTPWGVIPKNHVANVLEVLKPDLLRVSLMLQFNKGDWWNRQLPDVRKWGARRRNAPRRRNRTEKRKRIFREVWYMQDGSTVARNAGYDLPEGARAVVLKPNARVIDMSNESLRKHASLDPDIERLVALVEQQSKAVTNLTEIVSKLLGSGGTPDAIRTEDRLIVLNPEALEDEGPARKRWMQANRQPGDEAPRGSATWMSLPIAIEHYEGDERGPENAKCPCPYGYFEDTLAMDGDSIDVILGPMWQDEEMPVWVVEQLIDGETHQYKTMLGFESEDAVRDTFLEFWPEHMLGEMESCSTDEYRDAWFPELNEIPDVRTAGETRLDAKLAAGIIDLQGYDEKLAREIATAAVAEFGEDVGTREWFDRIAEATPYRLADVFPVDFLQNPIANNLFKRIFLVWDPEMSDKAKGGFSWHRNQGLIRLNAKVIFGESASYSNAFHSILDVLSHEIRHAADWAYKGFEAFETENPEEKRFQETITEEYVNSPTELKSWAGTVADRIFQEVGEGALDLGGTSLRNLINSFATQYIDLIAPENRRDFLSRVIKALEQRARLQ